MPGVIDDLWRHVKRSASLSIRQIVTFDILRYAEVNQFDEAVFVQ